MENPSPQRESQEDAAEAAAPAAELVPAFLAESTAEWVRMRGYKLLIINAEGTLKRAVNLAMPTAAGPKGGHDAFCADAVPLLRALLVAPASADTDPARKAEARGERGGEAAAGELRHDAPRLALLSDLGHQCTERESGPLLEETRVRAVLDNLMTRLCNELALSAEARSQLKATTTVYHSFVPLSCRPPSERDKFHEPSRAKPEWNAPAQIRTVAQPDSH